MKKIFKMAKRNPLLHDIQLSFYNMFNTHRKGNNGDIFLFTSARSGSTWFAEILSSQSDIVYVDEPLNWKRFISNKIPIPPSYEFIYSSPNRKEVLKKYFEDIFENRITLHFPLALWKDTYSISPTRYAFKLINGKELINWFEEIFDIKVVYLIRHPIATSLSRINWGWMDINKRFEYLLNSSEFRNLAGEELVNYANKKLSHGSQLEKFVTGWCIENYIPLVHLDKEKWTFVSYEQMVIYPKKTCKLLKNRLGIKDLDMMLKHVKMPSKSNSAYKNTKNKIKNDKKRLGLVTKWKNNVTDQEIDDVFEILSHFKIDIYKKGQYLPSS